MPWRVTVQARAVEGVRYFVAVGAPLDEAIEQWRTLLRACLIGIPLALAFAVGWRAVARTARAAAADVDGGGGAGDYRHDAGQAPDRARRPTELEQLARSFNPVLDRLGSALSTQRRFMADASHELRTPISIMRTAADVTLSRPSRDEGEYREALAAVSQQASRLTRLVDDMLVLARADGGGYPVVVARVDMTALVDECVRELRRVGGRQGHHRPHVARAGDAEGGRSAAAADVLEPVRQRADVHAARRVGRRLA